MEGEKLLWEKKDKSGTTGERLRRVYLLRTGGMRFECHFIGPRGGSVMGSFTCSKESWTEILDAAIRAVVNPAGTKFVELSQGHTQKGRRRET